MHEHTREEVISEIISEFSQSFAAARTRWTRFAEVVHPERRGPGMMILQTILRRGPVTATGLGSILDMDKAMVSRQVTKLRSLGLVDAKEAESDRRVILLTASETAHSAIEGIQARISALEPKLLMVRPRRACTLVATSQKRGASSWLPRK